MHRLQLLGLICLSVACERAQTRPASTPGQTAYRNVSGRYLQACALTQSGSVSCWGWNVSGQLDGP